MTDKLRRCILVVEDEPLLAMDVEMVLANAGFRVVGPAGTCARALDLVRDEPPDLTILDLNLGTELAFPVFDRLDEAGIPFIILSAHSREIVPARYRDRPFLQKPYRIPTLLRMIDETLEDARTASRCRVS